MLEPSFLDSGASYGATHNCSCMPHSKPSNKQIVVGSGVKVMQRLRKFQNKFLRSHETPSPSHTILLRNKVGNID